MQWVPLPLLLLLYWWARRVLFRRGWTQNKLIQQSFKGFTKLRQGFRFGDVALQ